MDFTIDPSLMLSQTMHTPKTEKKGDAKNDPEALRKTCQQFEAIFIQQMFKAMRATVPDSGLLDKDQSLGYFQDLMDFQVSQQMATRQGVGLADAMFRQLNPAKGDSDKPEK